jgi:hypothetical protein
MPTPDVGLNITSLLVAGIYRAKATLLPCNTHCQFEPEAVRVYM